MASEEDEYNAPLNCQYRTPFARPIEQEPRTIESLELVKMITPILERMKASDIQVLDVGDDLGLTDYFILASAQTRRPVLAMAGAVDIEMKAATIPKARIEGLEAGWWVLMDYDSVVVHIFQDEARSFYDLEHLWAEAPRIDWQE